MLYKYEKLNHCSLTSLSKEPRSFYSIAALLASLSISFAHCKPNSTILCFETARPVLILKGDEPSSNKMKEWMEE